MARTDDNLKAAFAGESQANRKYLAFAKAADKEGLPNVARLFRAAAEAETVHAHAHFRVLGGIGRTAANLQAAIDGETHEFKSMYPDFIAQADRDANRPAATSFRFANEVEKIHAGLYQRAKAAVDAGRDLPAVALHVCQVCGNTVEGDPPEKCPICGAPRSQFTRIA